MFSNSSFRLVYYVNTGEVNTYKDRNMTTLKDVQKIAMNPTGNSVALLHDGHLKVYSFEEVNKKLFDVVHKPANKKLKRRPVALAFSSDATKLLVSYSDGEILVCNTKTYQPDFILQNGLGISSALAMSANGYFIAAIKDKQIEIWNFDKQEIRTKWELEEEPTGIAFSNDGSQLAVTLPHKLLIYNTRTWEVAQTHSFMGNTSSPSFNRDDKYVSLIHNANEIVVLNVPKREITQKITETGVIGACSFLKNTNQSFIVGNRTHGIVYWNAEDLPPYYTKIVNADVDKKIGEWVKKTSDESADAYKTRVNDATRASQVATLKKEVTTALASTVLPDKKPDDSYLLNDSDEFVLANAIELPPPPVEEVVPLDILQIAHEAEANLKAARDAVMEEKKLAKLITDKTEVAVNTEVLADVDAEGNKILNYQVKYNYITFANGEDYPPGGYDVLKSNAAMSLMTIVKQTLEGADFAKYFEAGKRVKIAIVGSADGSPIRGKIAYDARYGNFEREPYYQNGELNSMTVTKATGITSNPQLAYIRTISVKDWISKNVTTLQQTRNDYQSHIEVAEEKGGAFRKVEVQFTIIDAFK
ncbi:hypothetical protein AGMMS49982_06840 [Bacteroidia bacterium]|nr:hypothetical protein AGMMS49982_06840 [Bacteroidia bacterium]